ncbi:MAG: hypothetical protein HZA22_02895 [Nitrospirae bacterium]|nr:hypothetical protein [Nitrospirota bacterium]
MPIYEYECLSCGGRFDALQKLSDEPLTECRLCKGAVRKLLGTPALQFKGSGWYITDYAGKTPAPGQAGGGSSEGGSGGDSAPACAPAASGSSSELSGAPACACSAKGCGEK